MLFRVPLPRTKLKFAPIHNLLPYMFMLYQISQLPNSHSLSVVAIYTGIAASTKVMFTGMEQGSRSQSRQEHTKMTGPDYISLARNKGKKVNHFCSGSDPWVEWQASQTNGDVSSQKSYIVPPRHIMAFSPWESLLELPQCSTLNTEIYFITAPEAGSTRSKCWQDWLLLRAMKQSVLYLAPRDFYFLQFFFGRNTILTSTFIRLIEFGRTQ